MASVIMHIAVASQVYKKITDKTNISYYDFILGTIAPDISKQIGQGKMDSHFITENNGIPNIINFLEKYRNSLTNSFNLGYYIHLYTDKIFFEDYFPLFVKDDILKSSVKFLDGDVLDLSLRERTNLLYNDYTNLNLLLIDEYNLDLKIFYNEFRKPITDITEIDCSKLNILIDNMGIIIENSTRDKRYIIEIDSVKSFIDDCSLEIYENLISLDLF